MALNICAMWGTQCHKQLPFGDGDIMAPLGMVILWWYYGFVSWVHHIVYVIHRDILADIHDIPSGKRENITVENYHV